MKVALKLNKSFMVHDDAELVFASGQMLEDVYYHEGDPLPSLEDFQFNWLTRFKSDDFWVYRQGTFVDSWYLNNTYVVQAKTADLDRVEASLEGYHHVPTICLDGAYKWSWDSVQPRNDLEKRYIQIAERIAADKN